MQFSVDTTQQHIRFSPVIAPTDVSFLSRDAFNKVMPTIQEALATEGKVSEYSEKELSKPVFAKVMLAVLEKEIIALINQKSKE